MKLLFLSNLFPDQSEPYRGLDNATLLHALSENDEIRVLSPRSHLPFLTAAPKVCREIDAKFQPLYPQTFYVPKFGSLFNHRLLADALRQPLRQMQEEFSFQAILVAWTFPDTAAVARLQRALRVPFVGIVQGSDAHAYLQMPGRRPTIVRALNQSSAVITRSARLAELLADAGVAQEKLHPIYNGVDLATFHPASNKAKVKLELGLSSQQPMLLFVGNFFPIKNPLLLVRAHAELRRKFPAQRCQLVMVGGGPLEQEVRLLANQLGNGENVILAGRKNAREVARYLQAADGLGLSSDNEGVPNVVLEALASGLPVLSTNVGGIAEIVREDFLGKLVERRNVTAMTEAWAELLATPPQTERIRKFALQFSWERAAAAYRSLLQAAVGE